MLAQFQKPPQSVFKGISHFNNRSFFEAHEYFENAWRETQGQEREFYRALLQISGGYYRLTQANTSGARKFFSRALNWLALFPDFFQGMQTSAIIENVQTLLIAISQNLSPEEIIELNFNPIILKNPEVDR